METVRIRDPGWKKVGSDPQHWNTLISTPLLLFVTFYFWRMNTVNLPSKNNKQKNLAPWRSPTKRAVSGDGSGYGSVSQRYCSADPDPYQNVTDPEHFIPKLGRGNMQLILSQNSSRQLRRHTLVFSVKLTILPGRTVATGLSTTGLSARRVLLREGGSKTQFVDISAGCTLLAVVR